MNNLRKIMASVIAVSLSTVAFSPISNAVEVSRVYNKTYIEAFEDADKVFDEDGIFIYSQNASATNVTMEEHDQGGKYMNVPSGGQDVQVWTKKGAFKHDVTVVDMNIRSVIGTSPFPLIRLVNNGARMDTGNGLFRFVNSNKTIRSYNQATGSYDTVSVNNEWINVRIILDSKSKTITTAFNGSQVKTVSTLANEWDNENIQIIFQSATGSTIMLDNFTVSDGTYANDVCVSHDFEHSSVVNDEVNTNFFANIVTQGNSTLVYDEETNNSYLDISDLQGTTVSIGKNVDTLNKVTAVEMKIKATEAEGSSIELYSETNDSSTPLFSDDEIIDDGDFHTYTAVIQPVSSGYKVSKMIDEVYVDDDTQDSGIYGGTDAKLNFTLGAACDEVAIDDVNIFYPQFPQLMCDLRDAEEVSADEVIELVSNTRINAASAHQATITADGEVVEYTVTPDYDKNSFVYNIEGGLQYETTYVITTGEAGVMDYFGQYYDDTITFTTETEPVYVPDTEVDVEYTINGIDIVDSTLVNGIMEVKFNVKSNIELGTDATGYIAYYDADGALIKASTTDVSVSGIDTTMRRAILYVTDDVSMVKFVIWDGNSEPLCETIQLQK